MSGFLGDLSAAQETALGDLASNLVNLIPSLELPPEYQNLWGVPLAGIDEETRSDSQKRVLLKFLRAREFDVEAALKMAENALKWRHSFRINELMSEEFPPEFDALGMIYKTDKGGHPVTWNFYQNIDYAKVFHDGVDKFIRWRIQLMEKAVQLLDFEKGIETVTQIVGFLRGPECSLV